MWEKLQNALEMCKILKVMLNSKKEHFQHVGLFHFQPIGKAAKCPRPVYNFYCYVELKCAHMGDFPKIMHDQWCSKIANMWMGH